MRHAKEKNWPEQILTPFDEPDKWRQSRQGTGKWIRPQFEQCCNLIHEAWPATRVYGSMHHAPAILFLPVMNVFCTNAVGEDPALGDKVRKGGKTFWQYSGTGRCESRRPRPLHVRLLLPFVQQPRLALLGVQLVQRPLRQYPGRQLGLRLVHPDRSHPLAVL